MNFGISRSEAALVTLTEGHRPRSPRRQRGRSTCGAQWLAFRERGRFREQRPAAFLDQMVVFVERAFSLVVERLPLVCARDTYWCSSAIACKSARTAHPPR